MLFMYTRMCVLASPPENAHRGKSVHTSTPLRECMHVRVYTRISPPADLCVCAYARVHTF